MNIEDALLEKKREVNQIKMFCDFILPQALVRTKAEIVLPLLSLYPGLPIVGAVDIIEVFHNKNSTLLPK